MEHGQGTTCVFVCVRACFCWYKVCVCVNTGLREFTHYNRSKRRTDYYSGTHTKSSTIAIKSEAISSLMADYIQRALTHACILVCAYMRTIVTNTIKYNARLLSVEKYWRK